MRSSTRTRRRKSSPQPLLAQLVREASGCVSLQVVKEFCNVMTRRSKKTAAEIASATALFGRFNLASESLETVRLALDRKERFGLQFYDSLMLAAAEASGCDTILTEDLNDGQVYCGVRAVNPFRDDAAGIPKPQR